MAISRTDIRRAFEEDEFYPVFQPQVELRTGQLVGFEVLARWRHRRLGDVPPDTFIPLLEKSGLTDALTKVMLEHACAPSALKDTALTLSINVSPLQLLGMANPERLAAVLALNCFPPSRLTIEITESALVDDLERAQAAALGLKALGCRLALDDFGTGYSSLKHLHALPFDELKVDKSFVDSMIETRRSRKIVASVIGLGQSLGLRTIAEGVETQGQLNMLLWLGCDIGQGWHYGKPVRAEDLQQLVAQLQSDANQATPDQLDEEEPFLAGLEAVPSQRLAQLQAIYDGAPVGMCFLDRGLRYVSLNRRYARMNGVPLVAHLGRTVAEVIPHVFPLVEPYVRRALDGEAIMGVEYNRPVPTESERVPSVLASYQPVRDEGGEVLGVSVALMDVTEQRRLEGALRESEEHFRRVMALHPHVPWVLNTNGEVVEVGPQWKAMTGQRVDDALGAGWLKMVHPDDVQRVLDDLRTSFETGQLQDIGFRIHSVGGSWICVRSRGAARYGPSGKILYFYGVTEAVQDDACESEDLKAALATLQRALDSMPFGVIIADAQRCTINMLNPAAKKIYGDAFTPGMTLSEFIRGNLLRLDGTPLKPDEYPLARAILRSEPVDNEVLLLKRQDMPPVRLVISCRPIYDDNRLIGGISIIRAFQWPSGRRLEIRPV